MSFMSWIIDRLNEASQTFYEVYLETYGWSYPFWLISSWFYNLSGIFNSLAWDFYYFSEWVNSVQSQISQVLDWSTIWSYILSYVPNLEDIRDWFYNWWGNVISAVDTWWSSTQYTVQGWIQIASQLLQDQVDNVNNLLITLQATVNELAGSIPTLNEMLAWWSNWTGNLQVMIDTWWSGALLEVQGLIDSAFLVRESFWSGWQDWRGQVAEFFTDPEDWLYKSVDRIFERFW